MLRRAAAVGIALDPESRPGTIEARNLAETVVAVAAHGHDGRRAGMLAISGHAEGIRAPIDRPFRRRAVRTCPNQCREGRAVTVTA
jgi:hypothetical protein